MKNVIGTLNRRIEDETATLETLKREQKELRNRIEANEIALVTVKDLLVEYRSAKVVLIGPKGE